MSRKLPGVLVWIEHEIAPLAELPEFIRAKRTTYEQAGVKGNFTMWLAGQLGCSPRNAAAVEKYAKREETRRGTSA